MKSTNGHNSRRTARSVKAGVCVALFLLVLLWARGVDDAVRFGLVPEDYRSRQTETEIIRVRPE